MLLIKINFYIIFINLIFSTKTDTFKSAKLQFKRKTVNEKIIGHTQKSMPMPQHAIQAARDAICYIDTKIINFYFMKNYTSPFIINLLKKVHRCKSGAINTFIYEEAMHRTDLDNTDPSLQVLMIPTEEMDKIDYCLGSVRKYRGNKKHLKYYLIFEDIFNTTADPFETWLLDTFNIMWSKNVLNAIAIFFYDKRIHFYTYDPFTEGNPFIKLKVRSFKDLFYSNLGNLHKTEVIISMTADGVRSFKKDHSKGFDGIDGKLTELLEEKLNATFIYKEPTNETYISTYLDDINITLTEGIVDVMFNRVNMSMNSGWIYQQDGIENTNSFEQNNLCVIVPKATQVPTFYNLFYTMEVETWIVATLFITIVTTMYIIMQYLNKKVSRIDNELEMNWVETHFLILQSFFGDSLTKLPKAVALRLVIISWLFYSLIISSAFTGILISKLAIPLYENDLETIDELKESGMEILIPDYMYQMRHVWNPELFESLKPQLRPMSIEKFYEHLKQNKTNVAYAIRSFRAEYEITRMFDKKTGRPLYHKMKQCLVYFPSAYVATKGSPYIGMVNDWLSWFIEAGFMRHWEEMAQFSARIKGLIADEEELEEAEEVEDEEVKVVLSIEHLQSAFILLSIGLICSILVFFGELIWHYYEEKRQNKIVYINKNLAIRCGYLKK